VEPNRILLAAIFAAAVAGTTSSTAAFAQQAGLVKVDIKNIADVIARNANLEASKIPLMVEAPSEVASDVCGVSENTLVQQGGGGGVGCVAKTTSPALEQIVQILAEANKK
jgi:hypothetical protein